MWAEQIVRAFWPLWTLAILIFASLMMGLHDALPVELVWVLAIVSALAGLWLAWSAARRIRRPTRAQALERMDAALPGRPIQAIRDTQAIGGTDPASKAIWQAHQRRMFERAAQARAIPPTMDVARRDPFALRYVALLALAVALLFGSVWRLGSVSEMTPGNGATLATGPTWEGWVEPPAYTGLPAIYLNDITTAALDVAEGSRITLRLYGEVGALIVTETVSGRIEGVPSAADPVQDFMITRSGQLHIEGVGGRSWSLIMQPDMPPFVTASQDAEVGADGEMTLKFSASDDYGVASGEAVIALDMDALDRRHGLALDPEPVAEIRVPLPMPITGGRDAFEETLVEDFSKHVWNGLPVKILLTVIDDAAHDGLADPLLQRLPGKRFFDPLAGAVAEMRRDLLWNRENADRVAMVLRAISHRPDDVFRDETAYLRLRVILRRLENFIAFGLTTEQRDEVAEALWDLAVLLEEGDLEDALERLRRAQDRLSEAMKNGASNEEIADLMQELRDATDEYLRQLSRQAEQDRREGNQQQQAQNENAMQMTQDDLQAMMDKIQELMEQGRMAEAEQAMEELRQMMENMQVAEGQQGQGGQSPGQESMDQLGETLREQQGLSDQAFRDLQEQFNPNAQRGQSQGNEGRDGGQGRGQEHSQGQGQQGEGEEGEGQEGQNQGQNPGEGGQEGQDGNQGNAGEQSLADRQEALRRELQRQRGNLPGQGSEQGEAAREALENAERAMEGAEEALRQNDLAEAIDRQAEAMEALREGLRNLGEALAQEQQQRNPGQQGNSEGSQFGQNQDPLGRNPGATGQVGTDEGLLQGDDVYRRARELLDEIRRRSGDGERPELELEYLERLLERF